MAVVFPCSIDSPNALARNERAMNTAGTFVDGQRINSASDDAAGLTIGSG